MEKATRAIYEPKLSIFKWNINLDWFPSNVVLGAFKFFLVNKWNSLDNRVEFNKKKIRLQCRYDRCRSSPEQLYYSPDDHSHSFLLPFEFEKFIKHDMAKWNISSPSLYSFLIMIQVFHSYFTIETSNWPNGSTRDPGDHRYARFERAYKTISDETISDIGTKTADPLKLRTV